MLVRHRSQTGRLAREFRVEVARIRTGFLQLRTDTREDMTHIYVSGWLLLLNVISGQCPLTGFREYPA